MFSIIWNCATILLVFSLISQYINGSEALKSKICTTELCRNASNSITLYMNSSVKPCDDFYEFACGNFETVNKYRNDVMRLREEYIFEELEKFLESTTESELKKKFKSQDLGVFTLAKTFLSSCKDEQQSETKDGIQPMADLIKKYGGWPVVVQGDNWDEENWDLTTTVGTMYQDGLNTKSILSVTLAKDIYGNSSEYVVAIRSPEFYIDKDLLLKNHRPYFEFMVYVSEMFGASEGDARIQMDQALYFEQQLAEITNQLHELEGVRIKDLQTEYPYLNWLKYIRSVLPNHVKINEDDWVLAEINSQYFMRLELLLKHTRKRTIANFLIWRAVLFSSEYLSEDLYQRLQQFFSEIYNEEQFEISRYDNCFDLTKRHLAVAINSIFLLSENQTSKLPVALKLANNVQSEFINMLRKVRWMDNKTKFEAIEKAKNMNIQIGQPTDAKHKMEIANYYYGLELSGSNFLENVLHVLRFEEFKRYRKLHQRYEVETHLEYHLRAATVNAFYYGDLAITNTVYITDATLAYNFVTDVPAYLNYGSLGYIIGHEITHGFDDRNRGQFINWLPDTESEFQRKSDCYKRQYENYGVASMETINENVADNGGVKVAYRAYQNHVRRHKTEPLLPGLKYTQQQLFWISLAQFHCAKKDYEINDDDHSPHRYRVIGMVQNMREFSRDFKCSQRSKMNPIPKCNMWEYDEGSLHLTNLKVLLKVLRLMKKI